MSRHFKHFGAVTLAVLKRRLLLVNGLLEAVQESKWSEMFGAGGTLEEAVVFRLLFGKAG